MYLNVFLEKSTEEFGPSYIHVWDDIEGYKKLQSQRYGYKLDSKGPYTTLYGQSAKKVRRWSKEAEDDGLIFEGDVSPEMRYLIDTYTNLDTPSDSHVELFLDIEVDSVDNFPNITEANNIITAISYYDTKSKMYTALILDGASEIQDSALSSENVRVYSFNSESELLQKFMEDYKYLNPTIITGWNIDGFDMPYLYNRLKNIFGELYANELSSIGLVSYNKFRNRYFFAGVSCLDYMALYKTFTFGERVSYSLDAIGKLEINTGKIHYEGTLDKLFKEDKNKFIEYNIHDVRIVVNLDKKLQFIELTKGLCHKCHCVLEDVFFSSRFLDGAILTYMKRKKLVAPNRPKRSGGRDYDNESDSFVGAYVKEPIPGKYKWVVDADFQSLYPSVIMSLNISPETKMSKIPNWDAMKFMNNADMTYEFNIGDSHMSLSNEKMHEFLNKTGASIASNGVMYDTKYAGIIPEILNRWFDERVEYKNLMKKFSEEGNDEKYKYYYMRQYIQKVILNSLYGVLGLPSFRFYDLDSAEATTMTGQEVIKYSEKLANHYYNCILDKSGDDEKHIIYVDTDSLFFSLEKVIKYKNPDADLLDINFMTDTILIYAKNFQDYINKSMNFFSLNFLNLKTHKFYIKQEIIAKSAFWTAKKRYALLIINKEGIPVIDKVTKLPSEELQIKGLDVVRTSFPRIFRAFMTDVLRDILNDVDKSVIDGKILELKNNIQTTNLSDIARPTGVKDIDKYWDEDANPFTTKVKGTPVHVKAAINYNDFLNHKNLNKKFSYIRNGDKIKWVYLKDNEFNITELAFRDNGDDPVELLEFLRSNVHYNKIFESELIKKLEDFYVALNWSELPTNINQNLSEFFEL